MSPFVCPGKFHQYISQVFKDLIPFICLSFVTYGLELLVKNKSGRRRLLNPSGTLLAPLFLSGRWLSESHLSLVLMLSSGLWEFTVRLSSSLPLLPYLLAQYWCQLGSGSNWSACRIRSSLLVLKCSSLPWVYWCDLDCLHSSFMWIMKSRSVTVDERLLQLFFGVNEPIL